ncbi:hypothetical protein BRADI_4g10666v3 [Brachypodium distachyon]|uniref:Large ribosomal subunit protein bL20c n=1 Tax=Brachypodium distachyon TaxID=15368 RepID=A0A0Q3EI09_BRADI|nr:hypothetical protein BRADI_4g10666v3 [Brachypodium distachyon]
MDLAVAGVLKLIFTLVVDIRARAGTTKQNRRTASESPGASFGTDGARTRSFRLDRAVLNRKMLAQVAVSNPNNLYTISKKIKIIN